MKRISTESLLNRMAQVFLASLALFAFGCTERSEPEMITSGSLQGEDEWEEEAPSESLSSSPQPNGPSIEEVSAALQSYGLQIFVGQKELPPTFPEDVPVPNDWSVARSMGAPVIVLFDAPSSYEETLRSYRRLLEESDWVFEKSRDGKGRKSTLSFNKGERSLSVEVNGNSNRTQVTVSLPVAQLKLPDRG